MEIKKITLLQIGLAGIMKDRNVIYMGGITI